MKKMLCLALAAIMTLGLFAGCGSAKTEETTVSTTAPAAAVEDATGQDTVVAQFNQLLANMRTAGLLSS